MHQFEGIITQGRHDVTNYWVTTYKVEYSRDEEVWTPIMNETSGEPQVILDQEYMTELNSCNI